MGQYYSPVEVVKKGQRIGYLREMQPSIGMKDVLVGIANNGVNAIAADLTSKKEYETFFRNEANWLNTILYRLPANEIQNCHGAGVKLDQLETILMEIEKKRFNKDMENIKNKFGEDTFVARYNGETIDYDKNEKRLLKRIHDKYSKYPDSKGEVIYVASVKSHNKKKDEKIELPSPEIAF
ncbi:hypothetical protein HYU07_05325 [Candidatus Woesearchaeota archaeon]|nr:hypothetical protein [Candidatus Woesearchaeota archaeon]